jgi:hypothetical protein
MGRNTGNLPERYGNHDSVTRELTAREASNLFAEAAFLEKSVTIASPKAG